MTGSLFLVDILEEHLEEADFLRQQRDQALASREYNLNDLAEVEERLLAHLDGLLLGERPAWKLLEAVLSGGGEGEVFAAAFVALESQDRVRIERVSTLFAEAEGEVFSGIQDVLRHTSYPGIEEVLRPLLHFDKGAVRAAALDVLSFRRLPVEEGELHNSLKDDDVAVTACALGAVGRLRFARLKLPVEQLQNAPDACVRREAMRASLLLGVDSALSRCRQAVVQRSEETADAMTLLGLAGGPEDAGLLIELMGDQALARAAIVSLGALGCVTAIEPLIRTAEDPKLARIAGEAVRRITAVNLEQERLVADSSGPVPAEAEDQEGETDPDAGLPFPDPAKLDSWWRANASAYDRNLRYRHGRSYGREVLIEILKTGTLPERHDAAFELAVVSPSYPYLETRAFCTRQRREMGRATIP